MPENLTHKLLRSEPQQGFVPDLIPRTLALKFEYSSKFKSKVKNLGWSCQGMKKKIQVSCKQTCVRTHDHTRPSVCIHTQAYVLLRACMRVRSCVHVSKSVLVFQISPVRHMSHNLPNWTAIPDSQKDTRRHKIKPRGFPRVPKNGHQGPRTTKGRFPSGCRTGTASFLPGQGEGCDEPDAAA